MSDTNVNGDPQVIRTGGMFSTDSINTLGTDQNLDLASAPQVELNK